METQRHVSLQIFNQHLFLLLSTTFTRPGNSLYSGGHCIPMSHGGSLESSCSNVQLIFTVHSAVLRRMLLSIFAQPCSHVSSEPCINRLLSHIFFTSIGMFKILHIVSKRSRSFRQSNFRNCSLVGASCLFFSLT